MTVTKRHDPTVSPHFQIVEHNISMLRHFSSEPASFGARLWKMSHVSRMAGTNGLLAQLPPQDSQRLAAFTRIEHPPQGRILTSAADPGGEVWFPHEGAVALIITDASGRSVQTGMVGNEGCIGLESLFGGRRTVPDAVIQIEGAMSVIAATNLRTVLDARPQIQLMLSTFLHGLSVQSLQTIACNRLHSLLSRGCRWLLAMHDKSATDDLPVTQENLATLLGGGRPRVNLLLATLERNGILKRYRGRIRVLNRAGLEHHSCECYNLISNDSATTGVRAPKSASLCGVP